VTGENFLKVGDPRMKTSPERVEADALVG